jgi:hypothetical protein
MKKTDRIFGLVLPVLLLSACGQDQAPSEDVAVVDEAAAVVGEPASETKVMAYGRFVPEREDDFTWENDKVAFRVYGPSSGGKGPVSGVDPWFKKVDYSIIDKWYANFLQGISYHEDHGEGYDIYHVGPSRGVGGTAIWIDGVAYPESKTISLAMGSQLYQVNSVFTLDGEPASLPIAIGLATHDEAAAVFSNEATGRISTWEIMQDIGVGTGVLLAPERAQEILHAPSEEKDASHIWLITASEENGALNFRAGFAWEAAGDITSSDQWNEYLDATASQ